jgi:16S rRNA processing protein RimM
MPDARILLGVVGRPHGVRGLLHVHSYTADPADIATYGELTDEAGRAWTLVWRGEGVAELRDAAGLAVADRTAAEKLVNTRLYVERDRLPAPDADEFYLADLVGLEAVSPDGSVLGRVDVVHDYGAGTSLEIGALLVPFTRACVPSVDVAAGRVVVVMPDEVLVASDPSPRPSPSRGEGEESSDEHEPPPLEGGRWGRGPTYGPIQP